MEDCVEDAEIAKLLVLLPQIFCQIELKGIFKISFTRITQICVQQCNLHFFHEIRFNLEINAYIFRETVNQSSGDQQGKLHNKNGQNCTPTNSRNNLMDMAGKNSDTLCCDMCNTKFGFLTRKVGRSNFKANCPPPLVLDYILNSQ